MVTLPALNQSTKTRLIFAILTVTLGLILWSLSVGLSGVLYGDNLLNIHFYDVGQGDAILIQKGDTQIVVDGGPNEQILTDLGRDISPWDREIELLVLTHPHADHLTGLTPVIERYNVQKILYYPDSYDTKSYMRFLEAVKKEGAEVLYGRAGGKIQLGEISLQILWPIDNYHDRNANNESLVLLLDYADFDALLLGDAEKSVQPKIVINQEVELLKVAHHGSWNGAYEPFLRTVSPALAVISVGAKNSYGHPHQQMLSLFDNLGIPYLRTDLAGTITVRSDGRNFWYDTER